MQPIVNGLKERFRGCLTLEHVNYHADTALHRKIAPLGAPEFALLDGSGEILYRRFGTTPAADFEAVLEPLCETSALPGRVLG